MCVEETDSSATGGSDSGAGGSDAAGGSDSGTGGSDGIGGSNGTGGSASYATELVIEEGEAGQCEVMGIVESTNAGFTGAGYLNSENAFGASIEWAVDIGEAGTYSLDFSYANESADRPADVLVNATVASPGLSFPSTSNWSTWSSAGTAVTLPVGESRILLRANSAAGLANIDSLTVAGSAARALDCAGDAGTGGASGSGGDGNVGAGGSDGGTGGSVGTGGSGTGGSEGTGGGGSDLADQYPCDGSTVGYDYVVDGSGDTHTINGSGSYSFQDAYSMALGSGNRSVLVLSSGDVSGAAQIRIQSNTILNVCGTINVTSGSGSDRSPAFARNASDIEIPHFNLTGNAQYGMFFREVSNLHLGDIYINGTGGLGIRIDSRQSNGSFDKNNSQNVTIDHVHVENTGGHGVEFYGVNGIEIGTVVARNTGNAGLLLNYSTNANIDRIDAIDAASGGTGYAAFRTANNNGEYPDGSYPTNIRLRELHASQSSGGNSGRGFFCVSGSGGVEIENFVIDNVSGSPAIFIENCYNVTMASSSGAGTLIGGNAHLGHNSGNGDASRDVTLQNITLQSGASVTSNGAICGRSNRAVNVTGGSVDVCE